MTLTGTWPRSLDDKGRLSIPKRVRADLGGSAVQELFVSPWTDQSLALFTPSTFDALSSRMSSRPGARPDVRRHDRLFYARTERLDVDTQGRLRLPEHLRTLAGLERDVVLLGVNDHLELWEPSRWENFLSTLSSQYDEIAEHAYE